MSTNPVPKGRAALLEKLRAKTEPNIGIQPLAQISTSVEPPRKALGRAALLEKLQQSRLKRVGVDPQSSSTGGGDATVQQHSSETATSAPQGSGDVPVQTGATRRGTSDVKEVENGLRKLAVSAAPATYRGSTGKPLKLSSNYVKLLVEKDRGVFEYEVKFCPEVDAKNIRIRMVNSHMDEMGKVKVFDGGACLYLPKKLPNDVTEFDCALPNGDSVTMMIIYKRKRSMAECLHLYNVLFKRIMRVLTYVQMGRNYFNPADKHFIPQHKLEVYPGFAVTVDELEDGLLLCLDTQHRVLRTQNVHELMVDLQHSPRFREDLSSNIIGSCVLTRYNNKTYIVHDILWDASPRDTFEGRNGQMTSFIDYYKNVYDITIKNASQPLLIHRKTIKQKDGSGKIDQQICLIPELCYLTGLTDAMRSDFRVMKDVAEFTRVTPNQRINALNIYLRNVSKSPDAQQILNDWGLKLDTKIINLEGRICDAEMLWFGNGASHQVNANADWSRAAGENQLTGPIDIRNWVLFHTPRDSQFARTFAQNMCRLGPSMGCRIAEPNIVQIRDDRNESYVQAISNYAKTAQVAVFICPTLRSDRYSIIKKLCCTQNPIPSQVIMSKTLANQNKVRTITQKIALQINCKLGGSLWTVRFPFKNWMIMGIDVYHGPAGSKGGSVCGMVASMNESVSRWFSTAIFQEGELSDYYKTAFTATLEHYRKVSGSYPAKIVIFRDGVGEGQLEHCLRYEVSQFEGVLKQFDLDISICFIVVQKRISTRLFLQSSQGPINPGPGTVLDHSITKKYLHDFFLIPQNVRQGTSTPTHYIVLKDTCNLKPDHVQRLAYKLCHLYYNWTGTIRVPAPCQYAHKVAALVGQHIKKAPAAELCDKLYYL